MLFDLTLMIGPAHKKVFGFTNKEIKTLKIKKKVFLKSMKK